MNKLDWVFKTLLQKRYTDPDGKYYYNEFGDNTLNIHMEEVWSDPIESPTISVEKGIAKSYNLFALTEDITVPDHKCYYAADPETGERLKDWISDKYGQDYTIHLYDNNNNEIFPTDECDWFFDYQTGILTFGGSVSGFARPFKVSGYRYIGSKGSGANDLKELIGNLEDLHTEEKDNLVSAINEIKAAQEHGIGIVKNEYNILSVEQYEVRSVWLDFYDICYIKGIYMPGASMRLKLLTKPLEEGGKYVYDSSEAEGLIWDVMTIPYISESNGRIYMELVNYGPTTDFNLCIYVEKEL